MNRYITCENHDANLRWGFFMPPSSGLLTADVLCVIGHCIYDCIALLTFLLGKYKLQSGVFDCQFVRKVLSVEIYALPLCFANKM